MNPHLDPSILHAALAGLEEKKQALEAHIAEVWALLGRKGPGRPPAVVASEPEGRTYKRSAATRRKMALAQSRRYAALRGESVAEQSETAKPTAKTTKPTKRKMSAEGLANIRAGVKKRLAAARRAAKKASAPT